MKTEVGRNWFESVHFDILSCRGKSFSNPKWTSSREEHKRFQRHEYSDKFLCFQQ
jgi:hypothetical protein